MPPRVSWKVSERPVWRVAVKRRGDVTLAAVCATRGIANSAQRNLGSKLQYSEFQV
jgi:hypothetical protein